MHFSLCGKDSFLFEINSFLLFFFFGLFNCHHSTLDSSFKIRSNFFLSFLTIFFPLLTIEFHLPCSFFVTNFPHLSSLNFSHDFDNSSIITISKWQTVAEFYSVPFHFSFAIFLLCLKEPVVWITRKTCESF